MIDDWGSFAAGATALFVFLVVLFGYAAMRVGADADRHEKF